MLDALQSLERAQASLADAVLFLANKSPEDPAQEDLQNIMTLISLGQYIQRDVRRQSSRAPRPLAYRLATKATSLLRWLQPVRASTSPGPLLSVKCIDFCTMSGWLHGIGVVQLVPA